MKTFTSTVCNRVGLHARPAALLVKAAGRFRSAITIRNATSGSRDVNAKSILMVLTLGVEQGHDVTVTADGVDEAEAAAALQKLIAAGLDEAEHWVPSEE